MFTNKCDAAFLERKALEKGGGVEKE